MSMPRSWAPQAAGTVDDSCDRSRAMNPPARGLLQAFVALLASAFGRADAVDPTPELRLCGTKPAIMAALSRASTQARSVPMHQRVTLQLSSEKSVVLPGTSTDLEQERAKAQGATYAGVVRLEATRPGSYRVSVDRDAWLDVATAAGKLLDPAPDEGTFDCDGAQKVLRETLLTVIPVD
jgi:hypothetical protein